MKAVLQSLSLPKIADFSGNTLFYARGAGFAGACAGTHPSAKNAEEKK
jgi:hypothetical protein